MKAKIYLINRCVESIKQNNNNNLCRALSSARVLTGTFFSANLTACFCPSAFSACFVGALCRPALSAPFTRCVSLPWSSGIMCKGERLLRANGWMPSQCMSVLRFIIIISTVTILFTLIFKLLSLSLFTFILTLKVP